MPPQRTRTRSWSGPSIGGVGIVLDAQVAGGVDDECFHGAFSEAWR